MRKFGIIVVSFTAIFSHTLFAQQQSQLSRLLNIRDVETPKVKTPLEQTHPLEDLISAEEYMVGPGDIFTINIWGAAEDEFQAMISPEGVLLIQNVGGIDLAHCNLAAAKSKISSEVQKKYEQSDFSVTLTAIREFKVSVAGAVMYPGSVVVTAADRVSDAIIAAGGLLQPAIEGEEIETPEKFKGQRTMLKLNNELPEETAAPHIAEASLRNIKVQRSNGATLAVDLLSYIARGKKDNNPYVVEGDVIFVPSREIDVGIIGIYGEVKVPGEYEFMRGDRVSDFIFIAHGLTTQADSSHAQLVRFVDNEHTTTIDINLSAILKGDSSYDLPLQPDDRIYLRSQPRYHLKTQVTLEGEILYPGEYVIKEGESRLSDIITQAGGFTEHASLVGAYVMRKAYENNEDPQLEYLNTMLVGEMRYEEREYYTIKATQKFGKMSVDFQRLFEEGYDEEDILLLNEDHIVVPKQGNAVNVAGRVLRPGLVPYSPGADYNYYIKEAGGMIWNARKRKVRIIKVKTGEWLKPWDKQQIEIGDTVFVPGKPFRDYWQITKDVVTVAAQIATLILIVQTASK